MYYNYRIVDFDCHVSTENKNGSASVDEMLRLMDKGGVDRAVITLLCGIEMDEPCDYDWLNSYVFAEAKKHSDRLLPMGWINPRLWNKEECLERVKRLTEQYEVKAIKINPYENYFNLFDEERSLPVIDAICKSGVLLAFHCGPDERSHPKHWDKLAAMYPDTKMMMIHMGQTPEGVDACIEVAKKHDNLNLCGTSVVDYSYLRKAVDVLGSDRVCFGTDAPFFSHADCINTYLTNLEGLSYDDKANVMGRNALRLLNWN